MTKGVEGDWVADVADRVAEAAERRQIIGPIVCASGVSPSGPIHLGNLRELMVPHLVADELRRRGLPARHLLSWDDYDRLRKIPIEVPPDFAKHIGRPLTNVPDPTGEYENWAEHFKVPFRVALQRLGVEVEEVSQTDAYRSGAYRVQILTAMQHRTAIYDILTQFRTKNVGADDDDQDETEDTGPYRATYSPYRPYCRACGRDLTHVTAYDDATTELTYHCDCGYHDVLRLDAVDHGKLVWKVDWPMRWAFEDVVFEAGGVDHSSPGSSFTVGEQIVGKVFGGDSPEYIQYSFVGTDGAAKMSGSRGSALTPSEALGIVEPSALRSLYCREPRKSFTVAFDEKICNLYEDWDRLVARVTQGTGDRRERAVYARSVATASAPLPQTPRVVSFRSLASVVDITGGDPVQLLRIVGELLDDPPPSSLDEVRPRLDCAAAWVNGYVPADERTQVRTEPDLAALPSLYPRELEAINLLLADLETDWDLNGLTNLVYGVPKRQLGLPVEVKGRDPELQAEQRAFFTLLYHLLVGRETGPRLPTLLLSLGPDRIRSLLDPPRT
ncbi:MAG: lysine--tRNA ligase [Acidimicrobiaceae bacterium]|nr:lysine--tRNA ligase [Acidimicrobiaceae bacterium]